MEKLATEERDGMSLIVGTVTHWVCAFIMLYGLYIAAYGHLTPGGGFAGGVILACGFMLMMLAFGKKRLGKSLSLGRASVLDCFGALFFWLLAAAGILLGGGILFKNFLPHGERLRLWSAGIIPLCNAAIALKVMASLVLVLGALSALRVTAGGKDGEFVTDIEE